VLTVFYVFAINCNIFKNIRKRDKNLSDFLVYISHLMNTLKYFTDENIHIHIYIYIYTYIFYKCVFFFKLQNPMIC